jgi:ATP-dependent Lon protease
LRSLENIGGGEDHAGLYRIEISDGPGTGVINLGGSIEPVHNPVTIAEIAIEKGATALLMPVACRRQLFDLSDDMATKIDIQFYSDAKDALLKAIME